MIITDMRKELEEIKFRKRMTWMEIAEAARTYPPSITAAFKNTDRITPMQIRIAEALGYDLKIEFVERGSEETATPEPTEAQKILQEDEEEWEIPFI